MAAPTTTVCFAHRSANGDFAESRPVPVTLADLPELMRRAAGSRRRHAR